MKHSNVLGAWPISIRAAVCGVAIAAMAACGGGSGPGETSLAQTTAEDGDADVWASTKYTGRWQHCISTGEPPHASSKLDTFEIEAMAANVLSYRQSRTYHTTSADCTLADGESWADKRIYRGHGTFELLGAMKIVNGVDSETALWKSEAPSDFSDAGETDKTTMGIKDEMLYIGDTAGSKDADGFPDGYYHALRRLP